MKRYKMDALMSIEGFRSLNTDIETIINKSEKVKEEIVEYCNNYAIDFNVDIPISTYDFGEFGFIVPNKRTALLRNLEKFSATEHWLEDYKEAYKLYRLALEQYEEQGDSRNILDNLRLSLELFLKEILGNNKSLENQYLGGVLEEKGISKEVRNLFVKIIEYYAKYQNEHVKHNNSINDFEVEYIVEQTSIMMNFIVKASETLIPSFTHRILSCSDTNIPLLLSIFPL